MEYSMYKDSGSSWLGEIPKEWQTCLLKYIFNIEKRIAGKSGHTVLSITQSGIKPKRMDSKGQFAQDYSKYQLVHIGDFAMNHMDLLTGWIDISKYEGVTSPDYRVFVNRNPDVYHSEYYKYIFQYCYINRIFYGMGRGVSGFGRWRLPADVFLNFRLPFPPFEEQKKIAMYLNCIVGKIDSIVSEEKNSIEEYKRWKNSLIYEAVTRGIDANRPLKDSGVRWIGHIPIEWDITMAKYKVNINHGSNPHTEGDIPVYGSGADSFKTCGEFKEGPAVLIGRKGTINIPRYIEGKYWNVDTAFDVKSIDDSFELKYYYYLANCFDYEYYMSQTTLPSMTQTNYNTMRIPVPNINEQKQIVLYLDSKCEQIDSIINEKNKQVLDLENYKKSLIFEVVTGKRKVV